MKKIFITSLLFLFTQAAPCFAQMANSAEFLLGSIFVLSDRYLSENEETDINARLEATLGFGMKVLIPGNKVRPFIGVDWTLKNRNESFIGEDRVTQIIPYFGIGTKISGFDVYLGANFTKWHYRGTLEGNISGNIGLSAGITHLMNHGFFSDKTWIGLTVHQTKGTFRTNFGGDKIEIGGITVLITGGIRLPLM